MEIDVLKLKEDLENNKIKLIDVRESYELEVCHIENSIHIPINQIPTSLGLLNINNEYAVICHSGIRSLAVTEYLNKLHYNVKNVVGGIDDWAVRVDKSMKRY